MVLKVHPEMRVIDLYNGIEGMFEGLKIRICHRGDELSDLHKEPLKDLSQRKFPEPFVIQASQTISAIETNFEKIMGLQVQFYYLENGHWAMTEFKKSKTILELIH